MRDILLDLLTWQQAGQPAALATVIKTWGSSPRPTGSHMAVSADGHFCGSVSGGCVESTVISESLEVIKSGEAKTLQFGVSDETAWEVGLACGGQIEVFVQPVVWGQLFPILELIQAGEDVWYRISFNAAGKIEVVPEPSQKVLPPVLEDVGGNQTFLDRIQPPRQLLIVGGVNLAQTLAELAGQLDFSVIVVDPRKSFLTTERFPTADQLIEAWPDEAFLQTGITSATAIAVLSHDDKIDMPALESALNSPAFYIGALGSQTTQKRRKSHLAEKGFDNDTLSRIHGPIGLDLGGSTPSEIALAILAEIIGEHHRKWSRITTSV
jgi:xanthine dehydrogenase accessory factor